MMVVDDSVIMRRAIQRYVAPLGIDVVAMAKDGAEAVVLFERFLPDLVTLDVTMPRMDGLRALQEILKIKAQTRVLIITALADPATGIQALKLGARGFLNKPFTEEELLSEVQAVLAADDLSDE